MAFVFSTVSKERVGEKKKKKKKKNAPRGLTLQMIREGGDEAARELPGFLSFSLASLSTTGARCVALYH